MKRAFLFALSLIPAFCLAEKQTELSEESQKQLADLVSANDYLAVVEINQGTLINIGEFCRVHDKVKVVANLKGNLRTSALFSSVNADINAFVPPRRIKPMPILIAGSYLVIVNSHEIANSKVGKPKPSFNYFIQHYEWAHCAWAVDSMEANYLRKLAKNFIQGD